MIPKSTILGVLMILAALAHAGVALLDSDSTTAANLPELAAAISGGLALIFGEKFSLAGMLGKSKADAVTPRPTAED